MAVTDELKQDVLEILNEFTAQLENQTGQNATPIMPAADVDRTVSMPAVKFDVDPRTNSRAVPQGYYQIPVADFFDRIDQASEAVEQATSDLQDLKDRTDQARLDTIDATSDAIGATEGAERVNATLVNMTVTITDRNGDAVSTNIGFEMYNTYGSVALMTADAENVPRGKFVMVATNDPTDPENARLYVRNSNPAVPEPVEEGEEPLEPFTFLSDLDQASTSAWADWLENMKPQIEAAILAANNAAASVEVVITRAGQDHTRAEDDHTRAEQDHSTATTDHGTATTDHSTAMTDHGIATTDHSTAGNDHTRAEDDHTQAGQDHLQASQDHSTAAADHETAQLDHQTASSDHTRAEDDHDAAVAATGHATAEGDRAQGYNDHPWEIRSDGFIWVWDEDHDNGDGTYGAMVRTNKMIIDFSDLTPEQQAAMVQEFLSQLTFDETPTAGSTNPVTSRGLRTAFDAEAAARTSGLAEKQDTLTFASDELCVAAAAEIMFS